MAQDTIFQSASTTKNIFTEEVEPALPAPESWTSQILAASRTHFNLILKASDSSLRFLALYLYNTSQDCKVLDGIIEEEMQQPVKASTFSALVRHCSPSESLLQDCAFGLQHQAIAIFIKKQSLSGKRWHKIPYFNLRALQRTSLQKKLSLPCQHQKAEHHRYSLHLAHTSIWSWRLLIALCGSWLSTSTTPARTAKSWTES